MKSLKDFKKFELTEMETVNGGADIKVDRTESNGWHTLGTSTDPGSSGGSWDWVDRGSGWSCSHNSACTDCTPPRA